MTRNHIVSLLPIFFFLVFSPATTVFGQDADEEDDTEIEEVIVTGTRIVREHDLAMPVQTVDSETIATSGEFSVAEVIDDLPALLTSTTSEGAVGSPGTNILSLRGMGSQRTLVLIDGRRHVGGVSGSSSVDVGSVAPALVQRVDVLSGGASAIYGADAVTGAVNFVLRDDYEGFELETHYSLSGQTDGQQMAISAVWGKNLLDGRANIAASFDWRSDNGLQVSEREGGALIGSARDWVNPALRFQIGDINESTPNFMRYYNYANTGLIHYGLPIPTAEDFITNYTAVFGVAPELTTAELALIDRAATAPPRAILPGRTFPFTSGYGYIIPGNPFTFSGFDPETPIDLDNNGVPDCLDSFTGYNSVFGAASFGVVGGCWVVTADGTYRPIRDGLVAHNFQGFGGDSFHVLRDERDYLSPPEDKTTINLFGRYELTPQASVFGEFKYALQESPSDSNPNSFFDLLFGAPDNPFLPEFLREIAEATGGIAITVDPMYFDARYLTERDIVRTVVGIEGDWTDVGQYELSLNYGRYHQYTNQTRQLIVDRFFAAIDVVIDPATGLPACRVDVDPTTPPLNTPFQIPAYDAGYFSFTPGNGQCVPLNIWAGPGGISTEAADWTTTNSWTDVVLDQFVATAVLTGQISERIRLPGGTIDYAIGAEHRRESSSADRDPWQRGVIPAGSAYPAGTMLSDVSDNSSLMFRPQLGIKNEGGEYDTSELFAELSLPILADAQLAQELTFDLASRWSNYSTVGRTFSWRTSLLWIPMDEIALRGGVSRTVRAPNISELFSPEFGITLRPVDPCDVVRLEALLEDDPDLGNNYLNNCVTHLQSIGLDPYDATGNYNFADPLSASFGGISGGNPNLNEETALTSSFGLALRPSLLPGFGLTIDVWDIEIEEAIQSVSSQDIVDGCYQGAELNQNFCELFTRNDDPTSAQFGGFNFLRTGSINFARIESSGFDFEASYTFTYESHQLSASFAGTRVWKLNFHTNPTDEEEANPELGEISRPELAGNLFVRWRYEDFSVDWHSQYLGEMLIGWAEIETAQTLYGDVVFMDATWIHDVNLRYTIRPDIEIFGGIRNLTETEPFSTSYAFPASPRGRMFYLRAVYRTGL